MARASGRAGGPLPHLPCIAHARLARTSVSCGVAGGAALFGVDGAAAAADTAAGAVVSVARPCRPLVRRPPRPAPRVPG